MSETTAVQPRNALPVHITAALRDLRPTLGPLLPPDITEEQFRAALYLELSGRPLLYECTPESLRDCCIKAANAGLLPGRDCHFLPFRNKHKGGAKDATFVPNYFGIILALERSGKVRRAFAHAVREGDTWEFDMFAARPKHTPAVALGQKPGKPLFYYGAVMFHDGTCAFEILTLEDLDGLKKRAPGGEQSVWQSDEEMMRRKSCIKRVAKYVKLTPEVRALLTAEEEREKNDIPPERHAANVVDLFGDQAEVRAVQTAARTPVASGPTEEPPKQHPRQSTLGQQIKALLTAQGLSAVQQDQRWQIWERDYHAPLTTHALSQIYEDLTQTQGSPTDANAWRTMLSDVLGDVRDAELVREAAGVLENADTAWAEGDAMLTRVLNALEAQDAQAGTAHPF